MGNNSTSLEKSSDLILFTSDREVADKYHLCLEIKCKDEENVYTAYCILTGIRYFLNLAKE